MPSNTTTPAAIRDRVIALIKGLTPTALSADVFRPFRNEDGDFIDWCETKPASAFRRFRVVETGSDVPPETSDGVEEERVIEIQVTVAYPNNYRYGADNALDQHDVIRGDQFKIEKTIGMHGKANFSPPTHPDASWIDDGYSVERIPGEACTYLQITQRMIYVLSLA